MVLPVNDCIELARKFSLCLIPLSLLTLLSACQMISSPTINTDLSQSSKSKACMKPIRLVQVNEKLANKESFYFYVGRPTCPYCRHFEPKLLKAIEDTQVPVFYLNTDEEDSTDVTTFVEEQGIESIPHLTYYKEGEEEDLLAKGSTASVDDIRIFLKTATK